MTITDDDLAELERLTNGATALPFERRPRTKYSPYSIQDARGYLFAEVDDGQNAELMVGASNALATLVVALRECRAERDKWIEEARRDNANRDYWKERAEAAEAGLARVTSENLAFNVKAATQINAARAEATRLHDIIRRCRELVGRWSQYQWSQYQQRWVARRRVPRHEDDKAVLADIAKVLEVDRGE